MSIELKNVTYTYSPGTAYEIHALKDINLSIPDGQFIGIIGHTGSGKSTLIQHFNALIRPTSGTITYNGEDIWGEKYDRRALRSEVGLVFQYPEHQLFENDVLSDVCFGPMNQGLSREEAEVEAKKALQHVGFKEKNFSKSPFELSGGQKKRVAIAGVLAMNPKILILDEPTAGLDPKGRDDILDQIAELHKVRGITIILVSHSMEDIAKYAERLIVVNDGEISYDDAPKAVFAHYRELEAMGLAAPQITYIMHALKEKGLDVDVTATTVDEAKENILAVLRKCNPGKLSGDKQSVSDSQSKKENAKAETLISEMEADLTEDGTKESHSDAPDEDLRKQWIKSLQNKKRMREGRKYDPRHYNRTVLSCRFRSAQNGSESKAGGYAGVHHLCLCIPYISGICSGNYISGSDDHSFQSSCEIYVQGTEGNRDASYDHSGI